MVVIDSTKGPDWVAVYKLSKFVAAAIQSMPASVRVKASPDYWHVHASYAPVAVKAAVKSGCHRVISIDLSDAALAARLRAVSHSKPQPWTPPPAAVKKLSDFDKLYLTADAPEFIVEAVWKALARKHHPDTGGNSDEFIKLKASYDQVKNTFRK